MTDVTLRAERADGPAGSRLLADYFADRARLPEGFDPDLGAPATADEMAPPAGTFLVAYLGDEAVACGGLKTLASSVGEVKRMYVAPEARGRGLGRRLLAALEEAARDLRLHTLRLDTTERMPEARRLYETSGYRQIARYNDNPYAALWFEKRLATRRGGASGW
jgi:GNAT superfamily N-acetyltransferase